ncbi:GntR family transcriptional regulator [Microbacterium sp. BWT-B31]|uniref:GntR family transcriptional regulator n=1 Tax=Microbacterium sp. BWT-B31 TaxID=3232072 RepID=UPI0035299997
MLLTVDPTSEVPLFAQLAAAVRAEAAAGRIHAGDRLPAAREVAAGLAVNVHTVLRAYQDLRDEGLVDLRRGRGAVLTAQAATLEDLRTDIDGLVARARAAGIHPDALAALVKEIARDR